eukprot:77639_1
MLSSQKTESYLVHEMNDMPVFSVRSKPITLKSGILFKKCSFNRYKPRLFELKNNRQLICFEVKSNGEKIKKDEIILNPWIKIEKRSGGIKRDAKFIIHIDENKKWYLWDNSEKEAQEWCNILKNMDTFYINEMNNGMINGMIKQNHMMLKNESGTYQPVYCVLNNSGKLNYFATEMKKEKKGYIDIINQCKNVEKKK